MIEKDLVLVSDFDGVIGDSLSLALKTTKIIVNLFDSNEKVNTFQDYYRLLGKNSILKNVTKEESPTLRELYRILLRHNVEEIKLFTEVIDIYEKLKQPPLIASSSYSDIIKSVLKDKSSVFKNILGWEIAHKRIILSELKEKHNIIYVTDTFRDILICKELGIPVIATTWGYDSKESIEQCNPSYIVESPNELELLLLDLNLIS